MPNRKTRPTSPGRRFGTYPMREELTGDQPAKSLTKGKKSLRRPQLRGRVTSRHRGGGAKRRYRQIDFKRTKDGVPARVASIEYDPNRCANIALLNYADGEKRYILAPQGLRVGAEVVSGDGADITPGNSLPLARIPTGTVVHNVELVPGQGGRLGRAAGTAIQVVAKEGAMVSLRLPSSEVRMVRGECRATVGTLSNAEHQNVKIGKAGRNRHKGKRPQTRGVAMNPVDHPHGGGEAHHTPGGHPVTPWGKPTLGYRTRKKGKRSDDLIVRGRRRGKRKRKALDGTLDQEGPVGRGAADEARQRDERIGPEADAEDLVTPLDDLPGDGRAHDRRPRRPQARAGLHLGVDGGAQAGRVRAHSDLPRPLGRRLSEREGLADG